MKRLTGLLMACATIAALALTTQAQAPGPIKVGILHSLSGTMAISETTLKDTVLMMIAEQNKKGGLLGRKLEAVVVDPASNWPLFAEKASQLLTQDNVNSMVADPALNYVGVADYRAQFKKLWLVG